MDGMRCAVGEHVHVHSRLKNPSASLSRSGCGHGQTTNKTFGALGNSSRHELVTWEIGLGVWGLLLNDNVWFYELQRVRAYTLLEDAHLDDDIHFCEHRKTSMLTIRGVRDTFILTFESFRFVQAPPTPVCDFSAIFEPTCLKKTHHPWQAP